MKFSETTTDQAVLEEIGGRVARQRLNRNMTQDALANAAGVSRPTVARLELGSSTQLTNLVRILRALDLLQNLDALLPDAAISPIQQLKLHGKTRRRARSHQTPERSSSGPSWKWGDDNS
jgi:transcriptional regulator with XRE-family HTH domain